MRRFPTDSILVDSFPFQAALVAKTCDSFFQTWGHDKLIFDFADIRIGVYNETIYCCCLHGESPGGLKNCMNSSTVS